MRKLLSIFVVVAAFVSLTMVVATPAQARQRFTCDYWNVLCTGQQLVDSKYVWVDLETRDQRFSLGIFGGVLQLRERVPRSKKLSADDEVWAVGDDQAPPMRSATTLTMQRDGNLVLRTQRGRVLWASHTAGSGTHNRLVLQRNGDLVIRTAAGALVWHSRTGHVEMTAGEHLTSGRALVNRYPNLDHRPSELLSMTRRGDLVLALGKRRVWHSDTHVAGSFARLRGNGRLEIVTPSGVVVWHSRAVGLRPVLSVLPGFGLQVIGGRSGCWMRPVAVGMTCTR